jgi:hypothetical protein
MLTHPSQGMEELIKQAFMSVEMIGPQVQRGQFDLIGSNGEIILPQVWDKVIQPDSQITMVMWPLADKPGPRMHPDHPHFRPMGSRHPMMPPNRHPMSGAIPGRPPAMPMGGGRGPPPPPGWPHPGGARPPPPPTGGRLPNGIDIVTVEKDKRKSKSSSGAANILGWVSGAPKKSSKK